LGNKGKPKWRGCVGAGGWKQLGVGEEVRRGKKRERKYWTMLKGQLVLAVCSWPVRD